MSFLSKDPMGKGLQIFGIVMVVVVVAGLAYNIISQLH